MVQITDISTFGFAVSDKWYGSFLSQSSESLSLNVKALSVLLYDSGAEDVFARADTHWPNESVKWAGRFEALLVHAEYHKAKSNEQKPSFLDLKSSQLKVILHFKLRTYCVMPSKQQLYSNDIMMPKS